MPVMPRLASRIALLAVGCLLATSATATASNDPTLVARGLLPADASWPAPFAGAPNAEPVDAPGARQPVGGFSALLDAPGIGNYLAMPDNGFGSKANSRSFLLRLYLVHADFETARGGPGSVRIVRAITLRDPDHEVPFAIVREGTAERLLTGGDFDIESVRIDRRGTLWFGEEFGPFLLHTDMTGKVLEAPVPLPDVKSPDYPADFPAPLAGAANLGRSSGFEGMAITDDGRTLLPVLEGPVTGDDPAVRRMYAFDTRRGRYTKERRTYRVADPSLLVSDFTLLEDDTFVSLERDNFQGPAAVHKRAFVVDLDETAADGTVAKRQVADLLNLADPHEISLPGRPGDIGLGNPFSMPYVTIESVLPVLGGDHLAIVNDTNFGSTGRNPSLPDDSDFIVIRAPGLEDD